MLYKKDQEVMMLTVTRLSSPYQYDQFSHLIMLYLDWTSPQPNHETSLINCGENNSTLRGGMHLPYQIRLVYCLQYIVGPSHHRLPFSI